MKKHIITLSGYPGSGKSSTADRLAAILEYKRFSSGDFMRAVAASRGLTLDELGTIAEDDRSVDDAIDTEIKKAGENDNLVIDSRLAYNWIPDSFKVYLKLDPHIAAARIFGHIQEVGRVGQTAETVEDVYEKMILRIESEKKRYHALYAIDYTNVQNFDLVVDTGSHTLEEVSQTILTEYKKWSEN